MFGRHCFEMYGNRFPQHHVHDGGFDLLVLGPKAAGTGLALTAATHVIHLSRWWNPAVQRILCLRRISIADNIQVSLKAVVL